MHAFRILPLALLLGACASEPTSIPAGPAGGKTDTPVATCSATVSSPFGDTSQDLQEWVVGGRPVTVDDLDGLSELEIRQLIEAVAELTEVDRDELHDDPTLVFSWVDEGSVEILDVELGDADELLAATWIRFYLGDNEVGVLFATGTIDIVAEVGDGDVQACESRGIADAASRLQEALLPGTYQGSTQSGLECDVQVSYAAGVSVQVGVIDSAAPVTFSIDGLETESATVAELSGTLRVTVEGAGANDDHGAYRVVRAVELDVADDARPGSVRTTEDWFDASGHHSRGFRCSNLAPVE